MKIKVIKREKDGYLMPFSEHTQLIEGLSVVEVDKVDPKAETVKPARKSRKKAEPPAAPEGDAEVKGALDGLDG